MAAYMIERLAQLSPERRRYTLQTLPTHLADGGQADRLHQLLAMFDFLQAKVDELGPQPLIDDYDLAMNSDTAPAQAALRLIQSALRLSAHVLAGHREELRGQLLGRLPQGHGDVLDRLRARVVNFEGGMWLWPIKPTLARSGSPLVRTIQAHRYGVEAVAVTPDWSRALSTAFEVAPDGERTGPVKVWWLADGAEVHVLAGHEDPVRGIALTSDGKRVASVGDDRTLRLWSLDTGAELGRIDLPESADEVHLLPDGQHALCVCFDELQLWDLGVKHLVSKHVVRQTRVGGCVVVPSGNRVVVADWQGSVHLLEIETWSADLPGGDGIPGIHTQESGTWSAKWTSSGYARYGTPLALDATGGTLFVPTDDKEVHVLELETGRLLDRVGGTAGDYPITALAVVPDGGQIVVGMNDGAVQVRDRAGRKQPVTLHEHENRVIGIRVSADGTRALTASTDGTLKEWDLTRFDVAPVERAHATSVSQIAIVEDGCRAVSISGDRTLKTWQLDGATAGATLRAGEWLQDVVALPDGRRVLTAESGATLRIWDVVTGTEIATRQRKDDGTYHALALNPDGRYAVVSWYIDDLQDHIYGLRVWDVERLEPLGSAMDEAGTDTPLHGYRLGMAADPGFGLSATNHGVALWRIDDGKPVLAGTIRTGRTAAVAWIPGTHHVAAALEDGSVEVWNIETRGRVTSATVAEEALTSIAVSADGQLLVVGARDRRLRLLRAETLEPLAHLTLEVAVTTCAITPDGHTVLAGDQNGEVHFFAVEGAVGA